MIFRKLIAGAGAAAVGLALAISPASASASELFDFNLFMRMADADNDGMVTKAEFMKGMEMAFDAKMAEFKAMPDSSSMMKGDAMTRDGARRLVDTLYGVGP